MAKKNDTVIVQIGDEKIELSGAEFEAFENERKTILEENEKQKAQALAQKELKISAYKKLGLTDEEIAAIL